MNSKVSEKTDASRRQVVKPRAEDPYYVPGLSHPLNGVYPRVTSETTSPTRN